MNVKIKKGLDLHIAGAVTDVGFKELKAEKCAVFPDDFTGFVPKVVVKEGDTVTVGMPLMCDKRHQSVAVTAPMAGTVAAVVRGERRKVEYIEIKSDGSDKHSTYDIAGVCGNAASTIDLLCRCGLFACLRQRPYDVVPDPTVRPRDIFVTGINSAPLAPMLAEIVDYDLIYEPIKKGVETLRALTDGKVYLSLDEDSFLGDMPGAEVVYFSGPHPRGNVGVQIAKIKPVNKGETVWTLDLVTLYRIGYLMLNGVLNTLTRVAVTGSEVEHPCIYETTVCAPLRLLLAGNLKESGRHQRIISGSVLSGVAQNIDGYLRFPYMQVTVIPEGDDVEEFMGWASLSPSKMSAGRTFPFKFLRKIFTPDARLNGGRRAMIMSGQYEKVLPMDIMAEYLIKAIISGDIEEMERLGIYEVAPEDFALCEYVDTSKLPLQRIVRDGLDKLLKDNE